MRGLRPPWIILLGFVLVMLGLAGPLLMVMRIIEPSLWLSFLSYAASVSGLILGFIGGAFYVLSKRR
ncbi:MAG: hypothetical protein ACOX9A_08700 [Anaerolineae bacterium]|jgi:hypothetical protein